MKKLLNNILDFVMPQFCLGCRREGNLCCGFCLNDIILSSPQKIVWPDRPQSEFGACYVACDYHHPLVQKILKAYKYKYLSNMSDVLTDILEKQARRLSLQKDTIISNVPLHNRKKRQRGFDQTEILARKLGKRLNKKYAPLLKRSKYTKAQAKLDKKSRQKNVAGVFEALGAAPRLARRGAPVLLIDDVTTTGSTLNDAARALEAAGYTDVSCLVVAKN